MRIAFVNPPYETVPTLSEGRSGSALMVWANEVAKRLRSEHTVAIVSPGDAQHPQGMIDDQGIQYYYTSPNIHRVEGKFVSVLTNLEAVLNYPRRKRVIVATPWFYRSYGIAAASMLSRGDWDVIHIHEFPQLAPVIRRANPRAKIVVHMHSLRLSQTDPALIHRYLAAADLVLAVGRFIADAFVHNYPDWADRCQVLNNGVDIERFLLNRAERIPSAEGKIQLLFVGRVSPEKGVHVLLKAFALVAERYPQAELNIVGGTMALGYYYLVPMSDDPIDQDLARFYTPIRKQDNYLPQLKAMIPPRLANQVHFIGSVPNTQVKEYLRTATAFIFPSVWHEPFSIALIEGMASGVPLVATRGGGNVEIVEDGKTGLIVERNNPEALAQAIIRLIENPALGESLSQAAQQRVRNFFDWDQCTRLLLNHYQTMLRADVAQPSQPLPLMAH